VSVLTVSDAEYSHKLASADTRQTVAIIKDINAILREAGARLDEASISRLLRRQAKAERRLSDLGSLTKQTREDYEAWRKREC